jgi:hypothetical protein
MEDLSHLVPSLVPSSMAAVNTVSENYAMTAPGSESESYGYNLPPGDPRLSVPPERERTVLHPSGEPRIPNPWRRADGTPWVSSADESSPGGESPGASEPGPWDQS